MLQTPNLNIADTDLLNVFRHMSLPFAVAVPALRYSALSPYTDQRGTFAPAWLLENRNRI